MPIILGILNVTPDSFSDGGHFLDINKAVGHAVRLVEEGADIIDVGGESTRPNATPVSAEEEIGRVVPVIKAIRDAVPDLGISIDTTKAAVAEAAIRAGATIVNDVSAFRLDPRMAAVCADADCEVILMHSRGDTSDMALYRNAVYPDGVMAAVVSELMDSVERAEQAGIKRNKIVLDPGIGFSKTGEQSIEALAQLQKLVHLEMTVMVGVSRKRFLGEITGVSSAQDRDYATAGANVIALSLGARWFRVHNVAANRQALDAASAILGIV